MNLFLFAPTINSTVGIIGSVAFFLIFLAVAYIVFRLLRKTVKMAIRLAVVATILLIAVVGSVSFWWLSSKPANSERPKSTRSR